MKKEGRKTKKGQQARRAIEPRLVVVRLVEEPLQDLPLDAAEAAKPASLSVKLALDFEGW